MVVERKLFEENYVENGKHNFLKMFVASQAYCCDSDPVRYLNKTNPFIYSSIRAPQPKSAARYTKCDYAYLVPTD